MKTLKNIAFERFVFFSVILILLSNTTLKSQDNILHRIRSSNDIMPFTTGYINSSGDTVVPIGKYVYCYTEKFDKIAFVTIKGHPGIYAIDKKENVLFKVSSFDNGPDPVNNGLYRIIENNKIGFANMNGEIIIQPQFDEATPFKNGFAVICIGGKDEKDGDYTIRVGGKWGLINTRGEIIVEPRYDEIRLYNNGYAAFRIGGNYYKKGRYLELNGGKWGLINTAGKEVLSPIYGSIQIPENGKVRVQKDGIWQIIEIK